MDTEQVTAIVAVDNLVKEYRRARHEAVRALDSVSLDFYPGEFVVLLGPSGCGKTTLLRSIAGLERPDDGAIRLRSEVVFSAREGVEVPPERRDLSMMFQTYALWPNMTVADNVRYPLKSRRLGMDGQPAPRRASRMPRAEATDRMRAALKMVGIPELEDRYPNQLSGGQQQRVALARALVRHADVVLFDEPLSNVDAKVRDELRRELSEMQRKLGFAAIYVTHDQTEAMHLGDRIVVMRSGHIEQVGSPEEIYLSPRSRFVANFVGAANELAGVLVAAGTSGVVETAVGKIHGLLAPDARLKAGTDVVASWRPESVVISADEPEGPNKWQLTLVESVFMGAHTECTAHIGGNTVRIVLPRGDSTSRPPARGDWISVRPGNVSIFSQ